MAPSSRDRISVDLHGLKAALFERAHPSSTPKAEFERFPRPGAEAINKLALQRQFFCSGTT
jgi:hypothetical protein